MEQPEKYFEVWAETLQKVYSDGSCEANSDVANDNIRRYSVDEFDFDGIFIGSKTYEIEDFDKIAQEHQPPEWQNNMW